MFRYFGFAWPPDAPAQAAVAGRLDDAVRRAGGWQAPLSAPGLRVYARGIRPGVNGAYRLPRDRGVILGRLFRRAGPPGDGQDVVLSPDDADRILATGGQALVDDYWGRYAAVLRPGPRQAFVLRDPTGTLPCYRSDVEGVAVFFSWLDDLVAFAPTRPDLQVDWEAVTACLALGQLGGRGTALRGVSQVLPGQRTPLHDERAQPRSLWSAVSVATRIADDAPDVAASRLRGTVVDCAHAWASCYDALLLRLSGGVDSAILLGSLRARIAATRVTCLNYHSPGPDSDECRFARLAAGQAGVRLVERARDAGFRLEDVLDGGLTPTPESYAGRMGTGRIDAAVAAAHGAGALFTGAGGDQLFFQLRCAWPAADYLRHHGLGRGFVRASLAAARLGRVSLLHAMRRALADSRHRADPLAGAGRFVTLARREALDGLGALDRHVHPDLLHAAHLPIGKFHQVRALIHPGGYYDPSLGEAAPELVNPLLSQPVVECCLALPTWLLTLGGRGRGLARQAFAADIPREIATRQTKGGMAGHAWTVLRRNLPLARGLLLDGHLVRHGLLDRDKVEAALAGQPSALGVSLAEIHDCVAIEAWLRRLLASPRPAAA